MIWCPRHQIIHIKSASIVSSTLNTSCVKEESVILIRIPISLLHLFLEALGFPVFCVDRSEQIDSVIKALEAWTPGEPIPADVGAKIPSLPVVGLPVAEPLAVQADTAGKGR